MSNIAQFVRRNRELESEVERMAGVIGEQEVTIADLKFQLAKAMQSTVEASELGRELSVISLALRTVNKNRISDTL